MPTKNSKDLDWGKISQWRIDENETWVKIGERVGWSANSLQKAFNRRLRISEDVKPKVQVKLVPDLAAELEAARIAGTGAFLKIDELEQELQAAREKLADNREYICELLAEISGLEADMADLEAELATPPLKNPRGAGRKPISEETVAKILELRAQGWSFRKIAAAVEHALATVHNACRQNK